MKYRLTELEIPETDVFQNDSLGRREIVEFIEKFLSNLDGPFVLALDSPWGTGKTTAIRMLQSTLTQKGVPCIYFNAWKTDYASDPLVALVSALDDINPSDAFVRQRFRVSMANVKKITTSIAKHGAVAAVKAATFGGLDIDSTLENITADLAGDLAKDLVDSFKKESTSLENLRKELEKAIADLSEGAESKPLVFFIDELDRCRPSFAIETLERIKHLFDVEHLVFVLSVDKRQLEASTCAIYGEKIDSSEYLRRFFDLELRLPQPSSKQFVASQINRFGLNEYFSDRKENSRARNDGDHFVGAFAELIDLFGLSLRATERAMARVVLVCSQTPRNQHLDPILVAFLVILRIKNSDLFDLLIKDEITPSELIEYVRSLPGGIQFNHSHFGTIIETYLIMGDSDQDRMRRSIGEYKALANSPTTNSDSNHANEILRMMEYIPPDKFYRHMFSVSSVASKIELASLLRN